MILAHVTEAGGGGGGDASPLRWVLLIAGLAVLALAARAKSAQRSKAQWVGIAVVGAALALASVAWPVPDKQPPILITVLTPESGQLVEANKPIPIDVRIEGGRIATSETDMTGGHLHVYVNDRLESMPYTATPSVTLPPGVHKVRVEFVDERHVAYNPPVDVEISLDARLPPQTP